MFKKLLVASAILASTAGVSLASSAPYVGASTGINVFTSTSGGMFRGVPATVFGGYGGTLNESIYLGGEVFGTMGTMTLNNGPTTKASLRSTSGYGIGLIPGIMLSDRTLAFIRAGLVRSYFSTIRSTATGGQLGLGLQTALTQNWDLRGEYDFTAYNSVGGVSPRSDLFNLGFVYKIS